MSSDHCIYCPESELAMEPGCIVVDRGIAEACSFGSQEATEEGN